MTREPRSDADKAQAPVRTARRRTSGLAAALSSRSADKAIPAARTAPVRSAAPARVSTAPRLVKVADDAQRRRPSAIAGRTTSAAGTPAGSAESLDALRTEVRAGVVRELGPRLESGAVDDDRLRTMLSKHLDIALRTASVSVGPSERDAFLESTFADMVGWGVLTALMADPSVTEVMCNGGAEIFVERDGRIEPAGVRFTDDKALRQVIDRMLGLCGRRVDESSPMADGRLADGSRINAVIPPLSTHGPVLTVRRFPETAFTITDLIARESMSGDAAVFMQAAVEGKMNILISGGTATGKTTLLNVMASFIPPAERIITIEDSAELRLGQPHVVGLEARPANIEGAGLVTIRDLVRNALRMRPDRIVVGEVRGGEALDMLQAMNTGHEGSMTTIHANGVRDALLRLETTVLMSGIDLPLRAIREQIASAFDLIVQLDRRPDGHRVVSAISEVQGREGDTVTLQDIFIRTGMSPLRATGLRPRVVDKLADRGVTIPTHLLRATPVAAGATRVRRSR